MAKIQLFPQFRPLLLLNNTNYLNILKYFLQKGVEDSRIFCNFAPKELFLSYESSKSLNR